jgi:Protein of unknown function (DUF2846)
VICTGGILLLCGAVQVYSVSIPGLRIVGKALPLGASRMSGLGFVKLNIWRERHTFGSTFVKEVRMPKLLLFVALIVASPAFAQDEAARVAAGCGPNEIQFDVKTSKKQHPKGELETGKALIYLFDDRGGVLNIGPAPIPRVGVDGTWLGANKERSYFFFSVAPGSHNLCTSSKEPFESATNSTLAATTFTAEAGQIYYFVVKAAVSPQGNTKFKIQETEPAQAELLIGELAFSNFAKKPGKK